jgi:acyl carrier protein
MQLDHHDSDVEAFDHISARVKAIWCEILGITDLKSDDHFLDLGGDSLDAMRCASRLNLEFDKEFTLQDFFVDDATVKGQALLIQRDLSSPGNPVA